MLCRQPPRAARRKGQVTADQLEQHHAQRKHVGRRADRAAQDLLWRGVAQGQATAGLAREIAVHPFAVVQQARNAEVQQLGLAFGCDDDVAGFEVAVHDELRVCVLHRTGDAQQQLHALAQLRAGRAHVLVEDAARHVLQHQVSLAVGHARVQQARHVGMVQTAQHGALAGKAGLQAFGCEVAAQEFDGRLSLVQAVVTGGQPDLAHAAFAYLVQQHPCAPALTGLRGAVGRQLGLQGGVQVAPKGIQTRQGGGTAHLGGAGRAMQHGAHLLGQGRVALLQVGQPGVPLFGLQRQRFIQVGRDRLPAFTIDHGRLQTLCNSTLRHAASVIFVNRLRPTTSAADHGP